MHPCEVRMFPPKILGYRFFLVKQYTIFGMFTARYAHASEVRSNVAGSSCVFYFSERLLYFKTPSKYILMILTWFGVAVAYKSQQGIFSWIVTFILYS